MKWVRENPTRALGKHQREGITASHSPISRFGGDDGIQRGVVTGAEGKSIKDPFGSKERVVRAAENNSVLAKVRGRSTRTRMPPQTPTTTERRLGEVREHLRTLKTPVPEIKTAATTTVTPIEISSRRVEDAYSTEERDKIHQAALSAIHKKVDIDADESGAKGSTMQSKKFSFGDGQFIALEPYKATSDKDFEERAFPLEQLASAGPIPEGLEFPVIIDRENKIIVTECAPGKYPMNLTAEEVRAITDEQLEKAASAVAYADSLGLKVDHKPDNLFVDPNKGVTIIDLARKKNNHLTAEQEFLYVFLDGLLITPSDDHDGLMARHELEVRAKRIAQQHWHPEGTST